jgi:hypothetical protein
MKKSFSFLAVVLTAFAAAAYGDPLTFIAVGNLSSPVVVGSTFDAPVFLESFAFGIGDTPISVYGFDMEVTFPSFLTVQSVTEEGFFALAGATGFPTNYVIDNVNGTIMQLFDASTIPDQNAPALIDNLFTIHFLVNGPGTGAISVTCDQNNDCADFPLLSDANFDPIPVNGLNGQSLTAITPEPSAGALLALSAVLFLLGRKLIPG